MFLSPEPVGTLKTVTRKKILHYRQLYLDHPEPIAFMPFGVDTSDRIYDDFLCFLFLYVNRETSVLGNEIPEESYKSGQFRFLRSSCVSYIKASVGLILTKPSTMRISIPLDLSSRSLYHYRVSFVLGDLHHFYLLPSSFLLCVLHKRHMMGDY